MKQELTVEWERAHFSCKIKTK